MKRNATKVLFAVFLLFLIASCTSKKEIVYFQNLPEQLAQLDSVQNNFILKPDDRINITVTAYDPIAVKPFNLVLESSGGLIAERQGYLIGLDGNINFPVLGKVKAAGLTTVELSEKLTEQISEFILDPIVIINVLNFKVSILGGVNSPGTYSVQGERLTLTEAISLAGDLSVFGKRDNILVLRENNGKKDYAYLDIRDVNIMESEYYYLQQNDVIYVEPNNVVVQQSGINPIVPYIIAIVSFITTIVVVFIK